MGVPKFFRYISERYPCLSEFCLEDKIPQFDNLYLDMNGIIHNCSHPDDGNIHFRISEETMFRDIFKYIDKLFYLIQPQKLFFMAVDGVAPRAKMNQQRSRRFRSAKDAETLEKNAQKRGEQLPDEARFDSNCITPGTEFMVRLQCALQYFVKYKVSTNPLWRKCRIILSGHETPGEGEHKIMEYIRYLKSTSEYNPNTRHCLYGLDADLIILGLCTHELHFSLLREEVKFGRKSKPTSLEETKFFLLHLGLLREYLELEFHALKEDCPDFDIERIIDDWILMGFLVGNDFIPHLPNLHINTNALPILYKAYIQIRPQIGGYINECGELNLERLEKYFDVLSVSEKQCFTEYYSDLKYFQAKRSGNGENDIPEAFDIDVDEIKNSDMDDDLAKLMKDSEMLYGNESDDEITQEELMEDEFIAYKRNYYIEKLKYDKVTPEVIEEQTECYIRALQWILYYYYCGVPSWEWFYPHHYAPFASDLKNFKHLKIDFELGKPFLPYQQLLAVLPAASKDLLPEAFRDLMTSSESELIEYYPKDFKTDLNGKKQDWEAVVLIPFIDEKKLLKAMEPCLEKLTVEESQRNKHGPMLQYDYSKDSQGSCEGPYSFKTLYKVFCTEKKIWRDEISVPDCKSINIMPKDGVLRDVYFPGFPTMKHLKYTGELRNVRVKVFEQPSRNENMILIPENRNDEADLQIVAQKYLNKEVFIGWPHLIQAKVIAVSTKDKKIDVENKESGQDSRFYELHKKAIIEHHMMRMGIDFQDLTVFVHCLPSSGSEYVFSAHGKMTLKKVWSRVEVVYPAQGLVSDISIHNPQFIQYKKVEDVFPVNSTIFMLGHPYVGCEGKVLDPNLVYTVGRIKISLTVLPEPNFVEAKRLQYEIETLYMNSYEASTILGIKSNCLARVTGSIFVIEGVRRDEIPENTPKINIGLQLKFPKNNEELSGYMRKVGSTWLYSRKAISLVQSYYEHYPKIFELISSCFSKDIYFESDLFSDQIGENCIRELVAWIKSQEHNKAERVTCGTVTMEKEAVEAIITATEQIKSSPVKCVKLQVRPHLILKPGLKLPDFAENNKRPLHLFDRIVVIKNTYQVPLSYKGTIVAIHPLANQNSVRFDNVKDVTYFYDILFDKTLPEGATLHGLGENRVFKISEHSILQVCTEDSSKPKNKISSVDNFVTNQDKSMSTAIKDGVTNKNINSSTSIDTKESTEENPLLSAIVKKIPNKNNGEQKKEKNSGNNFVPGSSSNVNSSKNNKFYSDNNSNKPVYNKQKQEIRENDLPITVESFMKRFSVPQQQQQQQNAHSAKLIQHQHQHQQQFSLNDSNNQIKSFKFLSKQDFLNPPSGSFGSSFYSKNGHQNRRIQIYDNVSNQKQQQLHQQQIVFQSQKLSKENPQQKRNFEEKPQITSKSVIPSNLPSRPVELVPDTTDTLKKLLGIDYHPESKSDHVSKEKISIRQNTPKSPPQPPSNWRVDALCKNTSRTDNNIVNVKPVCPQAASSTRPATTTAGQLPLSVLPPPPLKLLSGNSYTGIVPKNTSTVVNHSHRNNGNVNALQSPTSAKTHGPQIHHNRQQDLQREKPQHHYQHQQQHNYRNPSSVITNNPQSLSSSSYHQPSTSNVNFDITRGKGAFIPLQALKSAKKLQEQSTRTQVFTNKNARQSEQNQTYSTDNNVRKSQSDMISKKPFTKGKYRQPKIAAKFDNEFLSH